MQFLHFTQKTYKYPPLLLLLIFFCFKEKSTSSSHFRANNTTVKAVAKQPAFTAQMGWIVYIHMWIKLTHYFSEKKVFEILFAKILRCRSCHYCSVESSKTDTLNVCISFTPLAILQYNIWFGAVSPLDREFLENKDFVLLITQEKILYIAVSHKCVIDALKLFIQVSVYMLSTIIFSY